MPCFSTTDPCILLCEDVRGKCVEGIPGSFSLTMTLLFCDFCERWGSGRFVVLFFPIQPGFVCMHV